MHTVAGFPISATLATVVRSSGASAGASHTRQARDEVVARLSGPLRVAVLGRRGAGKSTLVNVLIGAHVAPTDLRECTQVTTWFHRGDQDRVEVHGTDGTRTVLGLDSDGMVPRDLGLDVQAIDRLEVSVTSAELDLLDVVDTPGLATTDTDRARRTREFVEGAEMAEAVIVVLAATARRDDAELVADLRRNAARLSATPLNTVVVLNQIDRFARIGDPWEAAEQAVTSYREALGPQVAAVIPLVGVLAESLRTGGLGYSEIAALRTLASEAGLALEDLDTVEDFLDAHSAVSRVDRQRLIRTLTRYGVGEAITLLRQANASDRDLHQHLLRCSGQPALDAVLRGTLREQADALKASWGVARLEEIAGAAPDPARGELRAALEEFLAEPAAHHLRVIDVGREHARGDLHLPAELAADLQRLLTSKSPAAQLGCLDSAPETELQEAAQAALSRWSVWATTAADPRQARAAAQVRRAYHLLWRDLGRVSS